jgi:transposase
MTLEERIQGLRLRAPYRAVELGNASQVCRESGISRSLFYRWKKRLSQYGPEGLHPRRRGCRRGRPPKVEPHEEQAILGLAISWPTWGPRRLSAQLARSSVCVAPGTLHRLLRRVGLGTRHERLAVPVRWVFSPSALVGASGKLATAAPATFRPTFPATWSAWTASTSASSKESARSGRSRPVMPPAPSPLPRSSHRWRRSTAPASSSTFSCPPTEEPLEAQACPHRPR